jgi:hypothetical protein
VAAHPFAEEVIERLVAAGFARKDATRVVARLYLGPDASPDDLFEVTRTVLRAKLDEKPIGSSHIRARSARSSYPPAR